MQIEKENMELISVMSVSWPMGHNWNRGLCRNRNNEQLSLTLISQTLVGILYKSFFQDKGFSVTQTRERMYLDI